MEKKKTCVICGKEFKEYGNNAEPVKKGTCCDKCNQTVVIPKRIELYISMPKKKAEEVK
jgi:hypothetical protein